MKTTRIKIDVTPNPSLQRTTLNSYAVRRPDDHQ